MVLIEDHLGLRQAVMALMNWAIDVPQKLLQSDAKTIPSYASNSQVSNLLLNKMGNKEELIIKES